MCRSLLRIAAPNRSPRSARCPLFLSPVLLRPAALLHRGLPILMCIVFQSTCIVPVHSQQLRGVMAKAIEARTVVGAQIIEGSTIRPAVKSINLGFTSPDRQDPVTQDTLFCIASCSKPLISCMVFRLLEQRYLNLNTPIDQWLPAYSKPRLLDGTPTPPPTLKQLLAHRAGIYSQKEKMTAQHLRAIRDFRITLSQSVNLIAQQPLQSRPGTHYAYSGAGYCLIGAIAEKATQQPIDALLDTQLCKPLAMSSTTFFPDLRTGESVATGGPSRMKAPHLLGESLKLPLVGGSIHSTAEDLQRFARMIADRGMFDNAPVLAPTTWSHYTSLPYTTQRYGYGWTRTMQGDAVVLSHNGSLPPSQAAISINLRTRQYKIALWTLAEPGNSRATSTLRAQVSQALNGK